MRVGIIGGGSMGAAIISSIHKEIKVVVCEQDGRRAAVLKRKFRVSSQDLKSLLTISDVIIVAVKPQDFDELLSEIKEIGVGSKLFISIAAGITTSFIENKLGKKVRVIRTMPNMPAQIGEGFTAICCGKYAKQPDLVIACNIFNKVGKTEIVNEELFDAVTAVSGSGPAYVFFFVECFLKAAQSLGLNRSLSHKLVMNTLLGSVHLLDEKRKDAPELRASVTSKGGTTQAAMDVLTKNKMDKIFVKALKAAKNRAKKLSK